jgi:hypothetical protein
VHKRYVTVILLLAVFSVFLARNSFGSSQRSTKQPVLQNSTLGDPTIINIDGDVSLSPEHNIVYWNPHSTGLTNASTWEATFEEETEISLKTSANETGHVATGAWWTTSFRTREKLPLFTSKPVQIAVSLRMKLVEIDCRKGNEWVRIALACAVQRDDGTVVYTETDVWDSPAALLSPNGNMPLGGNVIYRGGDVVEYKIDQAAIGEWKNYSVDLTRHIDLAWSLKSGDVLESAYIVVEIIGEVSVTVKIDDFWLTKLN